MKREFDVLIVGGFGHVGLPLGIVLADKGLQVLLFDINEKVRPLIEAGTMPFIEYDADPLLKKVIGKNLHVTNDIADVSRATNIIITIGTPVDEYLSPKTKSLFDLMDTFLPHLSDDQCVVLRSTVFPGTSAYLAEHCKKKGKEIHLAYCPERIVQGYAIRELTKLPQVVSGSTPRAMEMATALFSVLGVETVEVALEEAELTKLFLNAWRYIQFAAGNQFYMMAHDMGVDYSKVYKAMTHNYPRGKDLPRPGFAAGPCLLKDTMQLAAANRNQFLLGHAAMMANEGLPAFVVESIGTPLHGKKVGVLGMAFKADIDDTRDSLSYKLLKILRFHGAEVLCSDEFVSDPSFVSKEELLKQCDIVVVGVPHTAYKTLAVPPSCKAVDIWGVLPK